MRIHTTIISLVSFLWVAAHGHADEHKLELEGIFSDHAVIQFAEDVPVWGTAAPGVQVQVELAGQRMVTTADQSGRWKVSLHPETYGGPHELTVQSGAQRITVKDLMVGEVWLCGGQSNMQWTVSQSGDAEHEVAAADWPGIRLYAEPLHVATEPQNDARGRWAVCDPVTAADFSAAAYYFGRHMHKELGVPIGLVLVAWGGTPAEAWTSNRTLCGNENLSVVTDRYNKYLAEHPDILSEYQAAADRFVEHRAQTGPEHQVDPRPSPSAYARSAQTRYLFDTLRRQDEPQVSYGPAHFQSPSGLYNGMLHPIAPYGVRGAIWYQGESNVGEPGVYRHLLPAMIADWRVLWQDKGLPFGIVQLANVGPIQSLPNADSGWAHVRDVQRIVASETPGTGLIVTIDIGDVELVHAPNKQEVGRRIALWALATVYDRPIVYSGPVPLHAIHKGDRINVTYDYTGDGLMTDDGGTVRGFTLAGADGEYHWADVQVLDDTRLAVRSGKVSTPKFIRYRWAENPVGNLINSEGLPATPFQLRIE